MNDIEREFFWKCYLMYTNITQMCLLTNLVHSLHFLYTFRGFLFFFSIPLLIHLFKLIQLLTLSSLCVCLSHVLVPILLLLLLYLLLNVSLLFIIIYSISCFSHPMVFKISSNNFLFWQSSLFSYHLPSSFTTIKTKRLICI
jgi:hypothetical protein